MSDSRKKTIAVDLDSTLAHYKTWVHHTDIGAPISSMVKKVRDWLEEGHNVVIFTARLSADDVSIHPEILLAVEQWCTTHLGKVLPVTATKHLYFDEIHDDRAISIVPNTGVSSVEFLISEYEGMTNNHVEASTLRRIAKQHNLR